MRLKMSIIITTSGRYTIYVLKIAANERFQWNNVYRKYNVYITGIVYILCNIDILGIINLL